ncbi:MAG: hypothetical protein LBS91_01750 [Clostridiales Family XIII bacterium]|jgi:hypothetical protein|nr:hypothetical protein [Clostridiales Family XIII bacterium]
MDIYPPIFTRASTRKYEAHPLQAEAIEGLEAFISSVKPLLPDVLLTHRIVSGNEVKGIALPKAPHFLMVSGREHPLRKTAAGFLYQHAELWLYANGCATRWLGVVKPKQDDPDFIIGMAFGKPAGQAERKTADFKRKPLEEISKGADPRLEAARLAPSGMNGQPWYYIADHGALHTYCKKSLGGLAGGLYHLTELDAGIALCHIAVASEHEGIPFNFSAEKKDAPEPPQGFTYIGTVE